MESNNVKVPTTIFSGFLGSGKTTIISHLIDYLIKKGEKVAFIKNEIGDEDIDGKIMKGKNIKTKELLNGCICCTLVGPFINSINELVETVNPDRILIEASGAADPSAIALMVSSHPYLTRDGVVAIIDVINFDGYKDLSETARSQAKFTDLIVFNKVELVDIDRKRAVVGYVRELNQHAPVVETVEGKINPNLVFGVSTKHLEEILLSEPSHEHHLEHDKIQSFHCDVDRTFSQDEMIKYIDELPQNIIRIKGFVKFNDEVIRAVNKVGKRVTIDEIDADIKLEDLGKGRLVFIGFGVGESREKVCNEI